MSDSQIELAVIEDELRLLARRADGFENPKAIASQLDRLLSLRCVQEAARPNENSKAACVIALQQVLSAVIARVQHKDIASAATIYFFISQGLEHSTLKQRRETIESSLGIAQDSYRFGPEQRMRGVIAGELLRFELEAHGGVALPRPEGLDSPPASNQAVLRSLVSSLSSQYRSGEELAPLGSLVLPSRPPYYDMMIELALSDDIQADRYKYALSLTFTAALDEYVVGLVDRPGLCDVLLGDCQGITDIYSCSDRESRLKKADALANTIDTVTLIERTLDGRTRQRSARLLPVSRDDYGEYLGHLTDAYSDDVSLLRAPLTDNQTPRLMVRQDLILDKADHFCYWVADRPMLVRRIDVDISCFTPPDSGRDGVVTLQPFLMTGASHGALADGLHMSLGIENWLVRGQGVVVVW